MRRLSVSRGRELRDALHRRIERSAGARLLHRLHCVQLVRAGRGCHEVARWFDEHPRSVERWVSAWNDHGVRGLEERRRPGRRPRLDADALGVLRREVRAAVPARRWSGRTLAAHVLARFGVRLSPRQCQRLLRTFRDAGDRGC